jgi:tRNA (cmo5U34)-methyltransferase
MPSPTAADYFGGMAQEYDSLIARAVPRYMEMTERLLDYLPPAPARVLELGCGTGNLSLRLAAAYPEAAIAFLDAAPEMVELTRARVEDAFPARMGRDHFLVARFESLGEQAAGSFDLVTSAISLHHVLDKASLYASVHRLLAPGGSFCFADQMAGADEANSALNWQRWLDYCRLPGHCSEAEVESLVAHAREHDHYVAVPAHLRLLQEAGFSDVDCVWRNWMWGIVTARASSAAQPFGFAAAPLLR